MVQGYYKTFVYFIVHIYLPIFLDIGKTKNLKEYFDLEFPNNYRLKQICLDYRIKLNKFVDVYSTYFIAWIFF